MKSWFSSDPCNYKNVGSIGVSKFNYQPGSPSVYLEGINLSAARSTPNKLRPRDGKKRRV